MMEEPVSEERQALVEELDGDGEILLASPVIHENPHDLEA